MIRGVFVTGTDTGVGKTVTCAALLCRLAHDERVRYWKPIQTGIEQDDDTASVRRLSGCGARGVLDAGVRLTRPLSPHAAARLSGVRIDIENVANAVGALPLADRWIVEGAGGVLVPLNDAQLMVDLMTRLGTQVVVVARSTLGTINHTLLTLEALRARSLEVAGVVMVGDRHQENRQAIEHFGGVAVLGEIPFLMPLNAATLRQAADRLDCSPLMRIFQ
jgi:dethiobiotin synthetase